MKLINTIDKSKDSLDAICSRISPRASSIINTTLTRVEYIRDTEKEDKDHVKKEVMSDLRKIVFGCSPSIKKVNTEYLARRVLEKAHERQGSGDIRTAACLIRIYKQLNEWIEYYKLRVIYSTIPKQNGAYSN